jgi:hypothetical protein
MVRRWGRFVVYDLHTYNYRRQGPTAPEADPAGNPDINLGTGSMDRSRWQDVVARFVAELQDFDFPGRSLSVGENVRFRGGHLAAWVHATFPDVGCALAIEVKKFFMDEWSGEPDSAQLAAVGQALAATVPGVFEALNYSGGK